jgi:hypothetical protein
MRWLTQSHPLMSGLLVPTSMSLLTLPVSLDTCKILTPGFLLLSDYLLLSPDPFLLLPFIPPPPPRPAPAPKEQMQGVRGGGQLPAPAPNEQMQGVRGGRASASTSAAGANARSAGAGASAGTSANGANARSAGGRASASTSANGATARNAARRRTRRCRLAWRSSREQRILLVKDL